MCGGAVAGVSAASSITLPGCNGAGSGSADAPQPPYTLKRALKNGECRFPRGATSTGLNGPPWWVVSDAGELVLNLTRTAASSHCKSSTSRPYALP